jgi:hypothetical protein
MLFPAVNSIWTAREVTGLGSCEISALSSYRGSIDSIHVGETLLYAANLRQALERIDFVLKLGGYLIVGCPDFSDKATAGRRTGTQIQYELSCMFPDSYVLEQRGDAVLRFRKLSHGRYFSHGRVSLSLGYITDGRDVTMIRRTLSELVKVTAVDISKVLIAGPVEAAQSLLELYPGLTHVGDYRHADLRAPINRKKSLIIDAAIDENLILAHDRFYFDAFFWEKLGRYGNYFDFYNCRHCAALNSGTDLNIVGSYGMHKSPIGAFSYTQRSTSCRLNSSNPHFYNNGGLYVGKTKWFKGGRWPLHLHWGDLEDVHFTRRCELDGAVWRHDWSNRVFSTTKRLSVVKAPRLDQMVRSFVKNCVRAGAFWTKNGEFEVK